MEAGCWDQSGPNFGAALQGIWPRLRLPERAFQLSPYDLRPYSRTLAGAGRALVGLRGRTEDQGREVASVLVRRSRFAFFGGSPVFPRAPLTQDRRPGSYLSSSGSGVLGLPARARWSLPSRAPLQGDRRVGAGIARGQAHGIQLSPPGLWSSTALPARRIRSKAAPSVAARNRPTRGVQPPPPSTLGVCEGARSRGHTRRPRRFAPRRASRAASRRPGTLLRFRLQGLLPPWDGYPSRGPCSPALWPRRPRR